MRITDNELNIIDKSRDLLAFVDEAGDEGFNDKSCKWFVVGAILLTYKQYQQASSKLQEFAKQRSITPNKIHFADLPHNKKRDLCAYLSETDYSLVYSAFSKFEFSESEKALSTYPNMYFVGINNVIERGTWLCKQYGFRKVHFAIANRNKVKIERLDSYLFNSMNANKFHHYPNYLGKLVIANNSHLGVKCADIVTSSMFQALEPTGRPNIGDDSYLKLCIADKNRLFKSTNPTYSGIWCNGFKCTPSKNTLVNTIHNGILTEV